MNRGGRGTGRGRAGAAAASSRASTGNPTAADAARTSSATPTPGRTPSATPGRTPAPAARASSRASAITGRFRPKNVRRNEAERESIARQEEKKASDRAAEERRARGRGRFRSLRSRGNAMGARGRGGAMAAAAGPFGGGFAGPAGKGAKSIGGGGGFGGSGEGLRSGQSRVKGEGGPQFGLARDINREPRINADRLHAVEHDQEYDSDDEDMIARLSARASIMPMGIYRKKHQEAGVIVATTAELEAAENAGEEESLWVDGDAPEAQHSDQPAEEGVWDTSTDGPVPIKKDPDAPDAEESMMDLDTVGEATDKKEDKPKMMEVKVKKAAPLDPEEKVIQSDMQLLADELGGISVTDESGETKLEGPADKEGRMYLFQFPPLLPPLKAGTAPTPKSKVKAEPQDFSMADAPPAIGTPVDLTGAEDPDVEEGEGDDPEDKNGFMSSLLSQGGMVGQLRVRKSGKVELDWGGRILEMSPATGMNFLSTAVMVEQTDEKPTPGLIGGDGIGMGKIMGRFTLAPVWGEEEDWIVSPEELAIEQPEDTS